MIGSLNPTVDRTSAVLSKSRSTASSPNIVPCRITLSAEQKTMHVIKSPAQRIYVAVATLRYCMRARARVLAQHRRRRSSIRLAIIPVRVLARMRNFSEPIAEHARAFLLQPFVEQHRSLRRRASFRECCAYVCDRVVQFGDPRVLRSWDNNRISRSSLVSVCWLVYCCE